MNIIVSKGYAHRLTQGNIIQSAPATTTEGETKYGEWEIRGNESMKLDGLELHTIKGMLEMMAQIFYDSPLPSGIPQTPNENNNFEALKPV